ncbi:dienelactone hydrolase family protein [Kitasatospora sp. NBC_01287]|uniref:dienelactone hydrolase family protein n=1 Tax=Kitasatospora sp. NBC_01287 TaxID=2903573 RepID=UPI00225A8245|nr:dienelactone hydrolase family protein [Kitasatospora sp. NBC_01287]MCX4747241.1 dienelactone hydrolase family protein [Kitasatospora sp. NBC_01287]
MAEIVLYHHAQGLTEGVEAFAAVLRAAGHTVHTPDLYEGQVFATLEDGLGHARRTGFDTLLERGVAATEGLGDALVYAGFSLGVMPAQQLAQTRAGARGALLFHSCFPVAEFGDAWPAGVPVQVHGMDADPFFADDGDLDAARALADSTEHAELFVYPGKEHLFADSSLPSYDRDATELLTRRVLDFLGGADS